MVTNERNDLLATVQNLRCEITLLSAKLLFQQALGEPEENHDQDIQEANGSGVELHDSGEKGVNSTKIRNESSDKKEIEDVKNVDVDNIKQEIADEEESRDPLKTNNYMSKYTRERKNSNQSSDHPKNPMNHNCPACNRTFSTSQYLMLPLKDIHTKEVRVEKSGRTVLKCEMCSYESNRHMRRHMRMVHIKGDKKFRCERCPYATALKSDLKKHVERVHEKIRSHVCKDCGFAASEKGTLKNHILRKHEKIKNHVCNECGKAFPLKYYLKKHGKDVHQARM